MNRNLLVVVIILAGLFISCRNHEVNCTEEFRTIGVTVIGDSLSDYYTVRISNSDTIRFTGYGGYPDSQWYPVLDDNIVQEIANTQETFKFIGEINDSIVIYEDYIIRADQCHVSKVSGEDVIQL